MSTLTVIYDANALYPNVLRDILIRLAQTGIFHAHWTEQILDEVFHNARSNRPDLDPNKLRRTRTLICEAVDDCLVTEYENLIKMVSLPDPDDRHVLAAAIRCGARVIVTENKQDFPSSETDKYGIAIQGADEFLCSQIQKSSTLVHQSVADAATAFRNPTRTVDEVLDALAKAGVRLPQDCSEDWEAVVSPQWSA